MVLVLKNSHLQTPILSIPVFHNSNSTCANRHCVFPARHQNPPGYVSRKVSRHVKHMLSVASPPPVEVSENEAVGVVSAAQANFMRVVVEDGVELLCVVRALLKKIKRTVMVGDKVVVGSIDWVERRGVIQHVFDRDSEMTDPPVANVNHSIVCFSLINPNPEPFTLTRFLIEAESNGMPLTLALNKVDLLDQLTLATWKSRIHRWGYEPVFCSIETKCGLDTLLSRLSGKTSVIVGPSGVGKSSLINALRSKKHDTNGGHSTIVGSKWLEDQRVGEVSTRSGKGKHTTRNVCLLPLYEGGFIADTPGFNQPTLLSVTNQSLAQLFPEVRKMLETANCAFNDCFHIGEPGCAVPGDWERYPYYLQLLNEIKEREDKEIRTFGTKKHVGVKKKKGGEEPMLDRKKYRRQSRKSINQSLLDDE